MIRPLLFLPLALLVATASTQQRTHAAGTLVPNASLEADTDADRWPDGWAATEHGAWVAEDGDHFIRLASPAPGEMVMLYQEVGIPPGVEALEVVWRQRVSELQKGTSSWFDARILMEFLDGNREKVTPGPPTPATGEDTGGWVEKHVDFLVPEGARTLKFMPALFQVEAGVFDLDDIAIRPTDPTPVRERVAAEAAAKREKLQAREAAARTKAAALLAASGSLITNGGFESDAKADGWPDDWGQVKEGGSWGSEGNNHYLRLTTTEPGRMIMAYRTFDIPADIKALELGWKERITGLRKGEMPWFDARILMEFKDAEGKKTEGSPPPAYSGKDTDGWVAKTKTFLVPPDAMTLVMMPSLFQTAAGTFDLDDFTLKPTDPEPLLAAARQREKEAAARYVAPESPNRSKWPRELKVAGNRLHDPDGNEVWLQGVNAGGLETLPHDTQMIKSTVVAIDEWKANCVRLPIKDSFWYGRSPYQKDGGEGYRAIIDQIVTLAANRGAYVVIDLHRYRAPKQEHADFWQDCASAYKDHPAVLFDLLNEPHGIGWDVWRNGGFVGTKSGTDESAFLTVDEKKENQGFESVGMQGLVDAVRSTGAKNIVIAGGIFWCNDLSGIADGYALDDPDGNGVMYSWHTYNWHTGWEEKVLATAARFPILLGEVGADVNKMDFIPAADQEDPYTWVPDMLGFVQKHKLNWTGWCFHPKATPVMISDWTYTPTPFWGQFAKDALAGERFEMKRTR